MNAARTPMTRLSATSAPITASTVLTKLWSLTLLALTSWTPDWISDCVGYEADALSAPAPARRSARHYESSGVQDREQPRNRDRNHVPQLIPPASVRTAGGPFSRARTVRDAHPGERIRETLEIEHAEIL